MKTFDYGVVAIVSALLAGLLGEMKLGWPALSFAFIVALMLWIMLSRYLDGKP